MNQFSHSRHLFSSPRYSPFLTEVKTPAINSSPLSLTPGMNFVLDLHYVALPRYIKPLWSLTPATKQWPMA
jgi:hypothetical protein